MSNRTTQALILASPVLVFATVWFAARSALERADRPRSGGLAAVECASRGEPPSCPAAPVCELPAAPAPAPSTSAVVRRREPGTVRPARAAAPPSEAALASGAPELLAERYFGDRRK
jgi:hypothetical protein